MKTDQWLPVADVAKQVGEKADLLASTAYNGRIERKKNGDGSWLYSLASVQSWVKNRRRPSSNGASKKLTAAQRALSKESEKEYAVRWVWGDGERYKGDLTLDEAVSLAVSKRIAGVKTDILRVLKYKLTATFE